MIVRYSEGADKGAVRADIVQAVKGARPEEVLGTANAEVFAVEKPLEDAVRAAEALPGVKYAELDQSGFALFSPDDVYYVRGQQWGPKKINAEKAWDIARGDIGPGPDIGVLGTGYFHHPDLKDKVVSEYDCGSNDGRANPRGVHGTHVAGIAAAAADDGLGVAGMAPEADLFVGQVLAPDGKIRVKNVVQCGDLAMKRGVKVINLSLGFDAKSPLRLLQEAVDRWKRPRHQRRGRRRQPRLAPRVPGPPDLPRGLRWRDRGGRHHRGEHEVALLQRRLLGRRRGPRRRHCVHLL
jgi:thermitase